MTWNQNTPRGDLLPVDERPRFQGNWQYIETELQDDHFFDEDANRDGHHKKVACANIDDTGVALTGNDPTGLDTGTDGMYYVREKTTTEAPAGTGNVVTNPYFAYQNINNNQMRYKQLGFSALVAFRVSGGSITTNSGNPWDYQHNVSNVTRTDTGRFTITFTQGLPNERYLVLATPTFDNGTSTSRALSVKVRVKSSGSVTLHCSIDGTNAVDPEGLDVVVIGA